MVTTEDALQSSQSFVRALKSSTDPPHENGPKKIQIAREGWESCTLYVPRKAGLIMEWIFTRFHKEKMRRGHENPLLDIDYWSLLADIVTSPGDTRLEPIIFRASIPALVASFITLYPTIPPNTRPLLLSQLLRALKVLWPLSIQRSGLDPLAECLWPSLAVTDQLGSNIDTDRLVDLLKFVLTGYRESFNKVNAAGRKKAYNAMFPHQFIPWLTALHHVPSTHPLHNLLYSVGIDIIYNPDSLRIFLEANPKAQSTGDLFSSIFSPCTAPDPVVRSSLLKHLPNLYSDYIQVLSTQRSSLFSGTTAGQLTRERIRIAALRFGDECLKRLKGMGKEEMQESIWHTTLTVLEVTEKQALFNLTEKDYLVRMEEMGEDALRHLDRAWDGLQVPLAILALDVHSCLHRIDPELGVRFLPRILERIVTASPALERSIITYLNQLTAYYSKTRTLHVFISQLLSTFTSSFPTLPSSDLHETYVMCARSPLLSFPFMDELTNALRTFITPGQAVEVVRSVTDALEGFLRLHDTSDAPERKRRRVSSEDESRSAPRNRDIGLDVIKFALVARLGSTILSTDLQKRTGKDALEREQACLSRLDGPIKDALRSIFHSENAAGHTSTKARRKRSRSEQVNESHWTYQCLCSVILRLWYELFAERGNTRIGMETDENWVATESLDRLSETLGGCIDQDIFPELHLETGRVLFALKASEWQQVDQKEWPAFDAILNYVEANLFTSRGTPTDSNSPSLYFTRHHCALSLWNLMLERHLSTIDLHASQQQLDRFVRLIMRVSMDVLCGPDRHSSAAFILQRAFSSASFWEFCNLHKTILSTLDKQTAVLGSVDSKKWISVVIAGNGSTLDACSKMDHVSSADIEAGVGIYSLLHHFPAEYLSKASRMDLATRALNADLLVRVFNPDNDPTSQKMVEWRTIFRSFAVKVAKQFQMKLISDMASSEWLSYLTLSIYEPAEPTQEFIQATLELLSLIQISAARGAIKTEGASLISVLTHFLQCNPYSNEHLGNQRLVHRSLLQFINMLIQGFTVSSFQESVLSTFRQLCSSLEEPLRLAITKTIDLTTATEFLASEWVIEGWEALLSLKNRFSIELPVETFGPKLLVNTTRIMSSGSPEALLVANKFRATILSLIATESRLLPESDCQHVMSTIAAYLFFTADTIHSETTCDIPVSRVCKTFSVTQYQYALELVAEGLQDDHGDELRLITLIHLSILLLQNAPERTSKISHEHISRCVRIFLNRPAFRNCSSLLVSRTLDFVKFQCIERAVLLDALDAACILSIICRLLVGCSEHDERSSPSIFQTVVSVLNALVRLRRDLLGSLLLHFSLVLRQLIPLIRGVRPLLGVKQYRLVSDTFPKWIDPAQPLREAEANSLARLLTAFTTKNFVRSSHGTAVKQKGESLARPFARHAPYVLLSYLQLMNDPLSVLSASMRRELEPGLFALCSMTGEHGRDTLMVQCLDAGGKALLKSLWKEYDKHRYIGSG